MRQDVVEFIQKVGIAPVGAYQPKVVVPPPPKPPLQAGALVGRLAGGITNPNHVPFSQFKPIDPNTPNHQTEFFKTQLPDTAQNVLANQKVYSKPYPPKVYPVANLGPQKSLLTDKEAYGVQWPVTGAHPDPEINARLQKEREVLFRQMNPYMSNAVYPGDPNILPGAAGYTQAYKRNAGRQHPHAGAIAIRPTMAGINDTLSVLTHEIEHTNQIYPDDFTKANPRHVFNIELAPSLRSAAFNAEARRRAGLGTEKGGYAFDPLMSKLYDNYKSKRDKLYGTLYGMQAPTLQQKTMLGALSGHNNKVDKQNALLQQQYADKQTALMGQIDALQNQLDRDTRDIQIPYERIRAEAERHGVFDGRSMTDVLSRPEARQYFQRMYQAVDPTDSVAPQTQVRPIQTDSVPVDNYQPKSWWQRMFSR